MQRDYFLENTMIDTVSLTNHNREAGQHMFVGLIETDKSTRGTASNLIATRTSIAIKRILSIYTIKLTKMAGGGHKWYENSSSRR